MGQQIKQHLNNLLISIHNRILELRSVENLLMHPRVHSLYTSSTPEEKQELEDVLESKEEVIKWIENHRCAESRMCTIRQLKVRAQQLGIRDYSRMSKHELIKALKEDEKNGRD